MPVTVQLGWKRCHPRVGIPWHRPCVLLVVDTGSILPEVPFESFLVSDGTGLSARAREDRRHAILAGTATKVIARRDRRSPST